MTATATNRLTVILDPIPSPIVVGGTNTLTGSGFTAGSVVVMFVATATGAPAFGPFAPSGFTANELTFTVPTSVPLGNGFCSLVVVNTDEGFIQSNPRSALLLGTAGANLPSISAINGVALHPADPGTPLAYVETVIARNTVVALDGTDFNGALVNLFIAGTYIGPLVPLSGSSDTQLLLQMPADLPAGPGTFQVVNNPYTGDVTSNAVMVLLGAPLSITDVTQAGAVVTVTGTGFSTASVLNLFNRQGTRWRSSAVSAPRRFRSTSPLQYS